MNRVTVTPSGYITVDVPFDREPNSFAEKARLSLEGIYQASRETRRNVELVAESQKQQLEATTAMRDSLLRMVQNNKRGLEGITVDFTSFFSASDNKTDKAEKEKKEEVLKDRLKSQRVKGWLSTILRKGA